MTDFAISLKLLLKMKSSLNTDRKILCSILPNLFLSHHVHSQRAPTIWDELGDLHIFNIYNISSLHMFHPACSFPRCQLYSVSPFFFLISLCLFYLTLSLTSLFYISIGLGMHSSMCTHIKLNKYMYM